MEKDIPMALSNYDKRFYKKTLAIAAPVAFQALLNNLLNVIDTIMIGSLGEGELAAVGLANKVFFVLSLVLFGVAGGATVLTAQYWGKKDLPNVRRVLGLSLCIGLCAALLFLIAGICFPQNVMRIFTPNRDTILLGAGYLSIVALSYPFQAISQCYTFFYRAVNKVVFSVIITASAIAVNAVINYTLIYGKFGFPKMGLQGAAIGTLVARIYESLAIIIYVYVTKGAGAAKPQELFRFDKAFVRKFFKIALPVIFNESIWGIGVTMYALVYGRMGVVAVAVITATQVVEEMFVAAFNGLASATGVVLGNEMGANRLDNAKRHAKVLLRSNLLFSVCLGILLIALRKYILSVFNLSEEVFSAAAVCLLIFACYLPFKTNNYVNIVGILRSGGDTKYSLFLDFSGVWCIGVPLGVLGGLILKQPVYIVYAMVMFEEIYKSLVGYLRYRKKKWCKNIVG